MAKFEKGNPGKPSGAKNKINIETRELIQKLFDDNYQKIQTDLEGLEPKDRLKFIFDLFPYMVPKLQSTTYSQKIDLEGMEEKDLDILINRIMNE
jgi:hypothetical protein